MTEGRARPPRILHPESVPVLGTDDHLPPVAPDRLTPPALRQRFAAAAGSPWEPEYLGDGRFIVDRSPAHASVLVPLVTREDGVRVLLTQRTAHLRDHAGQISFPGGRAEPTDLDVADTALREAEEEVGLVRSAVEIIGQLPTYTTVTHFIVTPVVALVHPPFVLQVDPFEVAEAFEVPLQFLMTPAHHRRHHVADPEGDRQFLSMPWEGRFIWGATAAMLRNLYRFLAQPGPA